LPRYDHGPPTAGGEREPSPPPPDPAVWALSPAITRDDIPGLCEQLTALLQDSDAAVALCDVGAIADPDVVTIEALAHLQLTARRNGRRLHLRRANCHLRELLVLTGLYDVLPLHDEQLSIEVRRQPEQREQLLSVQKRVEPDDPAG